MYGISTFIYHTNQPNVGKYAIHGSYGNWENTPNGRVFFFEPPNQQPASNGAPKVWYARAESEGTRSFVTGAARICDPTAGEWWEIKTDVLKEAM